MKRKVGVALGVVVAGGLAFVLVPLIAKNISLALMVLAVGVIGGAPC